MALIELNNVTFCREGRTILNDISIEIQPGIVTAIMGSSGSGKSTLLNLMTGRLQPTKGTVRLFGNPITQQSLRYSSAIWKRIGFLFQSAALFNDLTVLENIQFSVA
ncbi:MAG: ATP-binding cassette domain-containing protein, partial [Gammaproteobacteria bacterium]|nr:ATP-binding cassette domain-containing protein [Gammaproteobacteria bacterium]